MKKYVSILLLCFALNSCGLLGDKVSPISIEALKTSEPASTGSISTLAVGGGSIAIASASAKVSAAAGALSTALSIQASADPIDNEGQGITINGDWTKPITVEFALPPGVTDPENYKIMLRLNNGFWVSCRKPKVNLATNSVIVRIAPSIKPKAASNARPMASKYSLAFAKTFFMKPDKGTIKVGESIKFTPYAREGFVPRKFLGKIYESDAELQAAVTESDISDPLIGLNSTDDDEVQVPKADDPDEIEPLPIVMKEFPFGNSKTGFTRTWTAKSIGTVKADGSSGATYTAPKDDAAKGKTVKVIFSSTNDKTKKNATAEATVRIEDGLSRYAGTITITDTREFLNSDYTTTDIRKLTAKVELIKDNATGTLFKHSIVQQGNKTVSSTSTKVLAFSSEDSDGLRWQRFTADQSPPNDGGLIYIEFAKDFKTYKIDGDLSGFCQIQGKGQNAPITTTNDFLVSSNMLTGYAFKQGPNTDVGTSLDNLSGKLTSTTKTAKQTINIITEWNLVKEK
jgi:hypothetical protein